MDRAIPTNKSTSKKQQFATLNQTNNNIWLFVRSVILNAGFIMFVLISASFTFDILKVNACKHMGLLFSTRKVMRFLWKLPH